MPSGAAAGTELVCPHDTTEHGWLFIPGTLCDARVFGPLFVALGNKFFGGKARLAPAIDSGSRTELAEVFVDGLTDRFYVVGFSLGCQVALEILRQMPDRCAGIVLISTTACPDLPEMAGPRRAMATQFDQLGADVFVENFLWENYVASPEMAAIDVKQLVFTMARDTDARTFASQIELAIARPSSLWDLSNCPCPVLMINGAQDRLTPPELGAEIARAAIVGAHRIIPGAGHFVLVEKPLETATIISAWIGAHDQYYKGQAKP